MTQSRSSFSFLINSFATVVTVIVLFLLPIAFLTTTTDYFILPKQILIMGGAFILLLLYCLRSLIDRKIVFVKNPLNLPVLFFAVIISVSAYVSPSSLTSLPLAMSVVGAVILFFGIVNLVTDKQSFQVIIASLIIGTITAAAISILSSFGIYLLPFEETKNEFFNTMGSPVQMIGFITPLIIFTVASVLNKYRKTGRASFRKVMNAFYGAALVLFIITIGIVFYQIASSATKPALLPFEHGFQLSLAAISQNEARLLPSFLFGAGYGMFSDVFTRFHLPSFNNFESWNLTFAFSSSYALELIATTGILGFLAYVFMIVKLVRSNKNFALRPLFLSTIALIVLSFIIPFSYPLVALLFILLGLYIVSLKLNANIKSVEEANISIVSDGAIFEINEPSSRKNSLILPVVLTILSAGFILYTLLFLMHGQGNAPKGLYHYVLSDMMFAESLKPDALNSGQKTYDLQVDAIENYPFRSDFYRIFSQVNLALATNLVNSQQDAPTVNEQVQQAIIQYLQVAINSSRQAAILANESSLNWRNLGQIYRNLIGVGDNAEQFAIASYNQAISLEPNNPALRIELGGIYYQLQEFDLAQNQFQVAASLKPDYANAYYNLGHSLESKGELAAALQQYQIVGQLVANDAQSLEVINKEIAALQERIGNEGETVAVEEEVAPTDDSKLELQDQTSQFPERDPREEIQGPPLDGEEEISPTPTPEEQQ